MLMSGGVDGLSENILIKGSIKPMTYSQVKGFQEEEPLVRRKVPQLLH